MILVAKGRTKVALGRIIYAQGSILIAQGRIFMAQGNNNEFGKNITEEKCQKVQVVTASKPILLMIQGKLLYLSQGRKT